MTRITHRDDQIDAFFRNFFEESRRVLFVGTLGFNEICLHFPRVSSLIPNIDYLFFVERRPLTPDIVTEAGERNRQALQDMLKEKNCAYRSIDIISQDLMPVAGRNAVAEFSRFMSDKAGKYTDVVVDTSSMSRGVCFSVAKQAIFYAERHGISAHLLVADMSPGSPIASSVSCDVACYMHGFQLDMETDSISDAIVLWVPQLAEGAISSLERIYAELKPKETCPVLPFPASSPRRADELLVHFKGAWGMGFLDLIYAHESDPTDVCETIKRLHVTRSEVFENATDIPARTVLTPAGWRGGSIGMLLAAVELDLPVMYTESLGYNALQERLPPLTDVNPECRWHIWYLPDLPA